MDKTEQAILKTVIYSDIFDYPLTIEEIWHFLITASFVSKEKIKDVIQNIKSIKKIGMYYVLKDRDTIVYSRQEKEKINKDKMEKARQVAKILSYIPTVFFIGVSGGVAMQNANIDDDIDFFIIVKKNTVWTTRIFLLLFLQVLGYRRKRQYKIAKDKICLNMFMDVSALHFKKSRNDIYTAHEIMQLIPLVDRKNTYMHFLGQNTWVQTYLKNAFLYKNQYKKITKQSILEKGIEMFLSFRLLENFMRRVQEFSIQKNKTSEIVTDAMLAFHPIDYRENTLSSYKRKVKQYVHI